MQCLDTWHRLIMSGDADFIYSQQCRDVSAIKAALKSFNKNMNRTMVLMKDLALALEGVAASFDAFTSLSFSDAAVKQRVHRFAEEIVRMKEGESFRDYNRLVHDDVLQPMNEIDRLQKEVVQLSRKRDESYRRYMETKEHVDRTEKKYAQQSKPLEQSKTYVPNKAKRDEQLVTFNEVNVVFQTSFVSLVKTVERVTSETMSHYLHLNAAYMSSVIEALTATDPKVCMTAEAAERLQAHDTSRAADVAQPVGTEGDRLHSDPSGVSQSFNEAPIEVPEPNELEHSTSSTPSTVAGGGRRHSIELA